MNHTKLRTLIFLALCCDLGLFSKRIIGPAANLITDALHIPGGIGTAFSLMFLVIAASLVPRFGCAGLMGLVQSGLALGFGMVGSMGALSPIGYIVPGLVIDITLYWSRKRALPPNLGILLANMLASAAASLTANVLVFRLRGTAFLLYLAVSLLSGAVCGILARELHLRLKHRLWKEESK